MSDCSVLVRSLPRPAPVSRLCSPKNDNGCWLERPSSAAAEDWSLIASRKYRMDHFLVNTDYFIVVIISGVNLAVVMIVVMNVVGSRPHASRNASSRRRRHR